MSEIDYDEIAPDDVGEVVNDTATDVPSDTKTDVEIDTELQIQEGAQAISEIDGLQPEVWQASDADERLANLQTIEDRMAEIQQRPAVQVVPEAMAPNEFGGWNGEYIAINKDHLNSNMPVEEFANTIVHEGRHAYQDFAIKNPGFVSDSETVEAWAANRGDGYFYPQDYGQEIYQTQPVEADAWNYANGVINAAIAGRFKK